MKLLLFIVLFSSTVYSQSTVLSAGNTIENNGSISYSVGQIFVSPLDANTGSLYIGVQQPFEILSLSLEDFKSEMSLVGYPNPTSGLFYLDIKNSNSFPFLLKLYDLRGRMIFTKSVKKNKAVVNISNHAKGMYILHLVDKDKNVYLHKILKK